MINIILTVIVCCYLITGIAIFKSSRELFLDSLEDMISEVEDWMKQTNRQISKETANKIFASVAAIILVCLFLLDITIGPIVVVVNKLDDRINGIEDEI